MGFAAASKFVQLVGLILLLGWPFFAYGIARPAGLGPVRGGRVMAIALAGWVLVAVAAALDVLRILQPLFPGLAPGEQWALVGSFLRHTEVGRWMAARLPAAAGYLLALRLLTDAADGASGRGEGSGEPSPAGPDDGSGRPLPRAWVALAAGWGLLTLGTVSVSGHAGVSLGTVMGGVVDGIHLLAAVAWSGALLGLAAVHARDGAAVGAVLRAAERTSVIGLAAVLALAATGVVLGAVHIAGMGVAASSVYGRSLGFKLAGVAVVVAIAAGHRWRELPALRAAAGGGGSALPAIASFRRRVRMEVVALVAVLGATAVMTQVWPPSAPGRLAGEQSWTRELGPWAVTLDAVPLEGARMGLRLQVRDAQTGQPVAVEPIHVAMDMETHVMGVVPPRMRPVAPGVYEGTAYLLMPGRWLIDVRLGAGKDAPTMTVFTDAAELPLTQRAPLQIVLRGGAEGAVRLAFGLAVAVVGLWIAVHWVQRLPGDGAWGGVASGLLFFLGGAFWTLHLALNPTTYAVNPVQAAESVAAQARPLYERHCASCHGPEGRGDGPSAAGLRPPPADFVVHVGHHREGEFFWLITHGVPRTAMPAFQNVLTDEERWLLARYVRELGFAGRAARREAAGPAELPGAPGVPGTAEE